MASACSSPTASKKTILFRSPRSKPNQDTLFRSKSPRVATSNQNLLYHILPSASSPSARTRLLKALASPENKQLDSQLSFKHLSNSIVDIRNLSNIKENIESSVMQSPKNVKPNRAVRLRTTSRQDGFFKSPKAKKIQHVSESMNITKEAETTKEFDIQAETSPKANLAARRGLSISGTDTLALREEMRKEYVGSPMIQTNEEALYYDTIKNLDVCGRCWTNCKTHYREPFKATYRGDRSSSYKKDFVPHSPSRKMPPALTNDHYEAYHSNHTVSLGTTMKGDFQPWVSNYVKHEGPKTTLGPDGSSLVGRSNYTSEFPDYKTPKSPSERFPQQLTTLSEIPFMGMSSYRQTFTDSTEPREFVSRWFKKKGRSPYSIGGSFMGETTNSTNFKPFKVEALKEEDRKKDEYEQTPVFLNQFKTNYTKDFDNKGEAPCPARVFIDQNPHPRLRRHKA